MSTKSQRITLVSLLAFITLVIILSFTFSEQILQQKTATPQISGGYLFNFTIQCVDTEGNLLKTESLTGNGTAWNYATPVIEGYTTDCASITKGDITNWYYPATNYDRTATGSCTVVYTPNK